jgi:RNA polymerase sigma factor (sigma-70 family)
MDAATAQDSRERFTDLYKEHYQHLENYAARRVPSDHVRDVVAATFLVAWRRFAELPEEPLPWLYGTARRVIANERRGWARWEALVEELATHASPAEPDPAESVVARWQLVSALRELSERDRELLFLVEWEQLSIGDASRVVGCSAAAARVRLHRARRRLADRVAPGSARALGPADSSMEEIGTHAQTGVHES